MAVALDGRREIEVELPDMHPGQARVMDDASRFRLLVAGRRWGKTTVGAVSTLEPGPFSKGSIRELTQPRRGALSGGHLMWCAPVYWQAKLGWANIVELADQIPGSEIEKGSLTAEFPGGGTVTVKSLHDPDRVRGAGYDGVVGDEAPLMRRGVWGKILRPMLIDRQGWALLQGTPAGANWFHDLWLQAGRMAGYSRHQAPSWSNPRLPMGEIEDARLTTPAAIFAQEYGAEFVLTMGKLFHPDWFRYFLAEADERTGEIWVEYRTPAGVVVRFPLSKCRRWAAVDPALSLKATADYTAIVVVCETPAGHLLVLDVYNLRLEQPDLVALMQQVSLRYRLEYIGVEKKAIGLGVIQQAKRTPGMTVVEVDLPGDKMQKATPVAMRMKAGNVLFDAENPATRMMELQLLAFPTDQPDDAGLGRGKERSEEGADDTSRHDDIVDALAMADADRFLRRSGQAKIRSLDD